MKQFKSLQLIGFLLVLKKATALNVVTDFWATIDNCGTPNYSIGNKTDGVPIPPDDGKNFGDFIYKSRTYTDDLLLRELLINDSIYPDNDAVFTYSNNFTDLYRLSTVRCMNLGEERAFVDTVQVDNSGAGFFQVTGFIRKGEQIRLLIEAYGMKNENL